MKEFGKSTIDFVITWVDGNDPIWQQKKRQYTPFTQLDGDNGDCRYRDWDFLKYWFRAIEVNAPWVRRIHVVTNGQRPKNLLSDHPKLHYVDHADYMKPEYLPTFSSRPIEVNMHRIEGLSEQFVYFNDDFFLNKPIQPFDFFKKGKPCYTFHHTMFEEGLSNTSANCVPKNCMKLINNHFTKWDTLSKGPTKLFSYKYGRWAIRNLLMLREKEFQAFPTPHIPVPFLKSTFEDVWKMEPEVLELTSSHRFRSNDDVTQYIFRFWDLARGNFYPYVPNQKDYSINTYCVKECANDIETGKHTFICINDNEYCDDFVKCRDIINCAFQKRYPRKSTFER